MAVPQVYARPCLSVALVPQACVHPLPTHLAVPCCAHTSFIFCLRLSRLGFCGCGFLSHACKLDTGSVLSRGKYGLHCQAHSLCADDCGFSGPVLSNHTRASKLKIIKASRIFEDYIWYRRPWWHLIWASYGQRMFARLAVACRSFRPRCNKRWRQ